MGKLRRDRKEIRTMREWRAASEQERHNVLARADPNYYRMSPDAQASLWRKVTGRFTADTLEPTESAAEYAARVEGGA
jgi:predicted Fe-S protein YdhL (DUF1289 family)